MNSPLERKTNLFLVRVWAEYLQRDVPSLVGEIENVLSKEKCYFLNIQDLEFFLQSYVVEEAAEDDKKKSEE